MCQVSVVTSVYNCERYIGETIESVLHQTFSDWEYIIFDDCSDDKSGEIIQSYADKDSRIKYYRNSQNKGQCKNLNEGIRLARGKYIARLDHDDLCKPDRFAKQLNYMEHHLSVVLLGSWMDKIGKGVHVWLDKFLGGTNFCFRNEQEAGAALLLNSIMAHSSFFIRKNALDKNNIWYDERYVYAEDLALATELLGVGDVFVLPEVLVSYRVFPEQWTQRYSYELRQNEKKQILLESINKSAVPEKSIWRKAIRGELTTIQDLRLFENELEDYVIQVGISSSRNDAVSNPCVRAIYRSVYDFQQINKRLLWTYATSRFRDKFWFLTRRGGALIKRLFFDK